MNHSAPVAAETAAGSSYDEQRTAWIGEVEGTTVILQGTASDSEFDHAAQAVADAADDSA